MKEFTYSRVRGLSNSACYWLDKMGLVETRWFLDTEWIISKCDLTYQEIIK